MIAHVKQLQRRRNTAPEIILRLAVWRISSIQYWRKGRPHSGGNDAAMSGREFGGHEECFKLTSLRGDHFGLLRIPQLTTYARVDTPTNSAKRSVLNSLMNQLDLPSIATAHSLSPEPRRYPAIQISSSLLHARRLRWSADRTKYYRLLCLCTASPTAKVTCREQPICAVRREAREETERFCSPECDRRGWWIKVQLSEEPAKARAASDTVDAKTGEGSGMTLDSEQVTGA
jgi:hypothetical protein